MAKVSRLAGSVGHILTLFIQDSSKTDGSGLAGLTNASSGLTCYYKRNTGSASAAVTLDAIATLGTYGSYATGHGGFKEIDSTNMPGFYEFQPPDAAYASGAKSVAFLLKGATNMAPCPVEIELTSVDNQDAQRGGMAALPGSGTLAVNPTLNASQNFNNTGQTTKAPVTLASTDVTGNLPADLQTIKTQAVTAAAGVTFPATIGTSTYAGADTLGTTTLLGRLTSTRATNLDNLDAAVSTRSTYAGGDTSGVTTLLGRIPGTVQPQTGDSYSRIGLNGAGLTAIGDTRLANLDATVSSRSTYAGGDTSGTTTLLARLTSTRATALDNLDATVSSRSTYAGGDTSGTTTLLGRLTATRAGYLDQLGGAFVGTTSVFSSASLANAPTGSGGSGGASLAQIQTELDTRSLTSATMAKLDVAVSTRLASASYVAPTTPPTVAQIRQEIDANSTRLAQLAGAFVGNTSVFSGAALANAPAGTGGGSGGASLAQIQAELDTRYLTTANVRSFLAVNCGDLTESDDHSTSSFSDIDDPNSTRVTSTNTPTKRTVTVH